MSSTPTAFLICSERSGSNLIRVMLDAHPEIHAPPPLKLLRDLARHFPAVHAQGRASPAWAPLRERLGRRLRRFYDRQTAARALGRIDALEPLTAGGVLHAVFETLRESRGARVLVVKENNLQRHLFLLLETYQDAQFLFQVRDPRDYLASARSLRSERFANKFGSTRRALELWREDQLGGLAALGSLGRERVFVQRYRDLIADPEGVLRQVCAFLGVGFHPGMLEFHQQEQTARVAAMGEQWKNLGQPVMAGNAGGFRDKLPAHLIRTVEVYLGDLMRRFGFPRCYPRNVRWPFVYVLWLQLLEPLERWVSGERAPFYSDGESASLQSVEQAADAVEYPYRVPEREGSGA